MFEKLSMLEKLTLPFYRLYYKIEQLYYDIKYTIQKLFKGYSDRDLWNLDYAIAKRILPMLIAYRDMEKSGYPVTMHDEVGVKDPYNTTDIEDALCKCKWQEILDDICWSIEYAANGYSSAEEYQEYIFSNYEEVEFYFEDCKDPNFSTLKCEPELKFNKEYLESLTKQYEQGMKLFYKYFHSLWD
jgi:hypothetical protein